ncbi:outer membrane beta-barrel family protein [Flavobacterium daejeonense]|uniref:outer membrane beta-barrel family protein n=1 Tax=Flavobacterium daejeonense TaxID=350893 RepID=UPI00047919A3|nr:outer membrane beta-barrel family protein [Flavobacterium daejeonense]
MKIKLILICLFGNMITMGAQNSIQPSELDLLGSISGKVIDKKTNEPLPFVNIIIQDNGKVVTGGVTSEKGIFLIKNLELKQYEVQIQFMGYKTITKTIFLSTNNRNLNLNTIAIEEDAIELKSVEIVSEKSIIEQKIDRKVINVGKDLISAGATASEIMNNIPSVSVDPQTNAISLRGNSNVKILIDGKPTNIDAAQLLQQIPSSSIKQIELITNPSAKYNPEGMSGMINIVLNKNSKIGFNGSINNGLTFAITPKVNSSFDVNYKKGKINWFANYGFNHGKYTNYGHINTTEAELEDFQDYRFIDQNSSHLAKLGFDFYWNEKNTISFYTNQNFNLAHGNSDTKIDFVAPNKADIRQLFNNKVNNHWQTYNLDYKTNFKKEGHTLELEINQNNGNNKEDAFYSDPRTNYISIKGNNTLINLDYVNPLSENSKLELGAESRIENTKNKFLLDDTYNSAFSYDRNIYSIYATFSKQWRKWNAQAGTRLEYFEADALFKKVNESDVAFNNTLFNFYPSAFLNYNPSEKNSFNLSFSKRVDRPSINQLNPIREWSTPQIDSEGNPSLQPQFTYSYELNYTRKLKIGSMTTGVFFRSINSEITRTLYQNPDDISKQILSYANLNDNNAYGFEISSNLDFTKWYSTNISMDAYHKKIRGVVSDESVSANVTAFNARINNTFKASKNLRFQLFSMYRGRDLGLQLMGKPMWKMDLGSSLNVLKGNGTISLKCSDIFKTMRYRFTAEIPKEQNGQFNWESRSVYVGFNYRFGSGKNKAVQRKTRDQNEVQGGGML